MSSYKVFSKKFIIKCFTFLLGKIKWLAIKTDIRQDTPLEKNKIKIQINQTEESLEYGFICFYGKKPLFNG